MKARLVHVFRHCVLMEDEGREHYERSFETLEKAQEWINDQNDYFHPWDYYIAAQIPEPPK